MASNRSRLNGLDHLRAFAILYVFLFHYRNLGPHPEWLDAVGQFGWSGVDLFFVLSGYLIGGQLLARRASALPLDIGDFYVKRFFRIVPVYLVVVAIYFLVPAFRENPAITPLWKFLTFTQNLAYERPGGVAFSHAWSLCVEEHFYLLLPAVIVAIGARGARRKAVWLAAMTLVGGIVIRAYSWEALFPLDGNWVRWIYYPTYARLDGIAVGVVLAAVEQFDRSRWQRWTRRPGITFAVGLGALVAAMALCEQRASFLASVFGFPLVSIAYGCIVVSAVSPDGWLHARRSIGTASVAAVSYSLYLVHKGVINATKGSLNDMGLEPGSNLVMVASLLASVAAASLLYLGVERWSRQIRNAILARRQSSPADELAV